MTSRLLSTSEQEALASRTGARRTVFFTKMVGKDNGGTYARTHQYLGEWKDNKWEGKGTLEKADGERYVGEWLAGKRHGAGTLWKRQPDGSLRKIYTGQWKQGLMSGRGTLNVEGSKDVYIGEWLNGQRSGVGICTYGNGDVYEGEWLADKRHGFGVYDYKAGDHFEGLWVEDKKEGKGVHFYYQAEKRAHTKRYDGEWVDDVPKCGYYSEMPPDPLVPASEVPDSLPVGTVLDSRGIISTRLAELRAERAHHRATRVPLDEHFTPEELEALRVAFSRVDIEGTGSITLAQLPAAFSQVGMEVADEEMAEVLAYLNKGQAPDEPFSFAEFSQAADFLSPVPDEETFE